MPLAADVQTIIKESLVAQLQDTSFGVMRQVARSFGNLESVEAQRKRLVKSTGTPGRPLYVDARFSRSNLRKPDDFEDIDETVWMVGVGKAKYADGRPRSKRLLSPGTLKSANLADVGDVYVLPRNLPVNIKLQGQGIGSAILRSMLDHYPEDMPAVIYEYPAINPRLTPVIESLGFKAIQERPGSFCGVETPQVLYAGPFCGDLVETLETRKPWLRERDTLHLAS